VTRPAIITCALTGVLTDPAQHPVPVTPQEMAREAREAVEAGASCLHLHFRAQGQGKGHLPSWDTGIAQEIVHAVRDVAPEALINMTTGVPGRDQSGPIACLRALRPDIAACNAGSLNYLKLRADGRWAWPPMVFDNPVEKISEILAVMAQTGTRPEFECFDTGILRAVGMFVDAGLAPPQPQVNLVMGVASGMPGDVALLELLMRYLPEGAHWQVTAIGRSEVWALHRAAARLGGHLRTGLEDTFYLPDGRKAAGNGALVAALAAIARAEGRTIATPAEARKIWGLA
jgi:3-keto-5-aminohexanoate cleavage enzyme